MNVGLFVFATDSSLDIAQLARRAEELGFDSFWVPEHSVMPVTTTTPYPGSSDGVIPEAYFRIVDPLVALGRASAVTERIKLGTCVCLVPEHQPVLLAKQVATLDHYSGGRFILGIGAGWLKEETEVMGGDFEHRWSQTREAVLAMKELWTKEEAEYHGNYVDFPPLISIPKPVQKPHPPVYLGSLAPNVFKRVAAWGDGWMPIEVDPDDVRRGRAALDELGAEAGREPGSLGVSVLGEAGQITDRKTLDAFEEAGADRVVLWLEQTEGPESIAEMEDMARWALS